MQHLRSGDGAERFNAGEVPAEQFSDGVGAAQSIGFSGHAPEDGHFAITEGIYKGARLAADFLHGIFCQHVRGHGGAHAGRGLMLKLCQIVGRSAGAEGDGHAVALGRHLEGAIGQQARIGFSIARAGLLQHALANGVARLADGAPEHVFRLRLHGAEARADGFQLLIDYDLIFKAHIFALRRRRA